MSPLAVLWRRESYGFGSSGARRSKSQRIRWRWTFSHQKSSLMDNEMRPLEVTGTLMQWSFWQVHFLFCILPSIHTAWLYMPMPYIPLWYILMQFESIKYRIIQAIVIQYSVHIVWWSTIFFITTVMTDHDHEFIFPCAYTPRCSIRTCFASFVNPRARWTTAYSGWRRCAHIE